MAYWAEINGSNVVTTVVVQDDAPESGTWVQTYKDRSRRKNYAGIGYTWDAGRDAFIPPTPYASWTLVEETCQWTAPVSYPGDITDVRFRYNWDEDNTRWVEV